MGETTAPHNHYATHGTINQLQLSAPKYCHSCANSQRQILKYDRQIRKTGGEANTKNGSGKYQSKQSGRGVRLLENVFRDRVGNDLRHGGISRSLCRGWQEMILQHVARKNMQERIATCSTALLSKTNKTWSYHCLF